MSQGIELFSTDELINEIKNRGESTVVLRSYLDHGESVFSIDFKGPVFGVLGLLKQGEIELTQYSILHGSGRPWTEDTEQ